MNYKIKYKPKNGFVSLIDENNALIKNIQFGILSLKNSYFNYKILNKKHLLRSLYYIKLKEIDVIY